MTEPTLYYEIMKQLTTLMIVMLPHTVTMIREFAFHTTLTIRATFARASRDYSKLFHNQLLNLSTQKRKTKK